MLTQTSITLWLRTPMMTGLAGEGDAVMPLDHEAYK